MTVITEMLSFHSELWTSPVYWQLKTDFKIKN